MRTEPHIGQVASLADVEQKLRTWLTRFYQDAPHAGIRFPFLLLEVFGANETDEPSRVA